MILLLAAFITIHDAIPEGPFCYPGKHKREILTFDPDRAPLFNQAYQRLKNLLEIGQPEEEILFETLNFVQTELFDFAYCNNRRVVELIYKEGMEYIPLETFLREKIGVCRHIALTVTLLVNALTYDGYLSGKSLLIREDLFWGRHAWTLVLTETGAWHLDAFHSILENGKTRAGFSNLCQKYGREIMERQKKKWKNDD